LTTREEAAVANLRITTADALKAQDSLERQAARWAARQQPLMQLIFRTFLERGGPIVVEDLIAAWPDSQPERLRQVLQALDDEDLIRLDADRIDLAYPFSAVPTPFRVRLSGGRERYACCAMDALGIAPMTGETIEIGTRCYHCGSALTFVTTPEGPGPDSDGVMVWFGKRGDERCKVADGL
jgi:Alkylmercury lyase